MLRFLQKSRCYCKIVTKSDGRISKIDFKQLRNPSKVPTEAVAQPFPETTADSVITIDAKQIQLLERLSLVDLDSKEALATLKSSIQFADKIAHIDTTGVKPLYSVLETQNLTLREDHITAGYCREEVLQNAKITDEDYFVAPPGNIPLEQEEKQLEDK